MSFDWCRIWWEFFGQRRRLAVGLVWSSRELIGLFPMYIDSIGRPPFGVRIARIIGATDGPTRLLEPPVRPDLAHLSIRAFIDCLLDRQNCDLISLGTLKSTYPGLEELETRLVGERCQMRIRPSGVVTFYDLSARPEDYLTTLPASEQKKRRYDFRYLARYGAKEALFTGPGPDVAKEFHKFVRMHTNSWEAKGRPGHFRAWPQAPEYQRKLAEFLAGLGRLRLFKIEVNSEAICYDYGFIFGRSFNWELPARSLDKTWAKISLGSCALIAMLRRVVLEGVTCLYAGVGSYSYKTRLGAKECTVVTVRIFRKSMGTRIRIAAYDLFHTLIKILYFKIWYMRVQPRLPQWGRRPIWKFWARMAT